MKTTLALSLLLLAVHATTPVPAEAAPAAQDTADTQETSPLKFVTLDPGKAPPEFPEFGAQVTAYRKAAAVPENAKVRIGIKNYYMDGVGFKNMIAVVVPLNDKGEPDGLESTYKEHIGLIHTAEYKNGLKHGIEKTIAGSYGTAYVRVEVSWAAGKLHGPRRMFHPNKKLMTETIYENGVESGESKSFDAEGKLIRTITFKAGKREGDMTDYWPANGKPKRVVPYKDGKIEGVVREFFLDGGPKIETPFKADRQNGIGKEFAPDGAELKKTYWVDGDQLSQAEYEKSTKK